MCSKLQDDETSLQEKIAKKQSDLDRCKKRLSDLENVRPAFMDEFEKLEHELERYNQEEQEKLEESERNLRRMQKRLKEEELMILRGEHEGNDNDGGFGMSPINISGRGGGDKGNVYGSMSGGSDSDSDDMS